MWLEHSEKTVSCCLCCDFTSSVTFNKTVSAKPLQFGGFSMFIFWKHFSVMLHAAILSTDSISSPPQFFMKVNSDGLKLEIIA